MIAQRVCTADPDGTVRTVAHFDEMPGGIGFLPDGTPLIVGIPSTRLFAIRNGHPEVYAELGDAAEGHLDDMAVATDGTAYVGAIGQITPDMENSPPCGAIIRVEPNGTVSRDADNLAFPNGAVVTGKSTTVLVHQTFAELITAFDIGEDGRLMNRRTWATLPAMHPDGLAVDQGGAAWIGCFQEERFVRVLEGGQITDVIATPGRWATGVELAAGVGSGGSDHRPTDQHVLQHRHRHLHLNP